MRDADLVRQASLRATGADIHEVLNLISGYEDACAIASSPESHSELLCGVFKGNRKALVKWAEKCRRRYERCLRAYVVGVPVRHAVKGAWARNRQIRSARAFGKIKTKRLRRFDLLGWVS